MLVRKRMSNFAASSSMAVSAIWSRVNATGVLTRRLKSLAIIKNPKRPIERNTRARARSLKRPKSNTKLTKRKRARAPTEPQPITALTKS